MNDDQIAGRLGVSTRVVERLHRDGRLPQGVTGFGLASLLQTTGFLTAVLTAKKQVAVDVELETKEEHKRADRRAELYQALSTAKDCGDWERCSQIHEQLAELNGETSNV